MIRAVTDHSWPRPAHALLPIRYRRMWQGERVPDAVALACGLPSTLRLDDLDSTIWAGVVPVSLVPLANHILQLITARLYHRSDPEGVSSRILIDGWRPSRPVEEFAFAQRTSNVLSKLSVPANAGWMAEVTAEEFLALRGAGALTLLDFATICEANSDWNGPRNSSEKPAELAASLEALRAEFPLGSISSRDPRLVNATMGGDTLDDALENSVHSGSPESMLAQIRALRHDLDQLARQDLEASLLGVLKAISPDHVEALAARFGWHGQARKTQQEVGEIIGVSRARAHQIEKRFREKAQDVSFLPALDAAITALTDAAGSFDSEPHTVLQRAGLALSSFDPAGIAVAADIFSKPIRFHAGDSASPFMLEGDSEIAAAVGQVVKGLTDVNHVASVAEVQARVAEAIDIEPPVDDLRALLNRIDSIVWLDSDRDWFWDGRETRYINMARKILSVSNPIPIESLRSGVLRHHRTNHMSLPRLAFEGLCRVAGFTIVDGQVSDEAPADWKVLLGDVERTIVEVMSRHDDVMMGRDLRDSCVERGINRHSYWLYLSYSPLLERVAPGVYALRGRKVDPSVVAEMSGRDVVRTRPLQDHGWTKDGAIWLAYAVNTNIYDSGVIGVPFAVGKVIGERRLELYAIDGSGMGTLAVGSAGKAWGLTPFIGRRGVDVGDYVVVSLDLDLEVAVVQAGTRDLVLTYEEGEGPGPRRILEAATFPMDE